MNVTEMAVDLYRQNAGMVAFHLADFSDVDMLVRPAENANHAAWQLGHLGLAFGSLINAGTPGAVPMEPQEFTDRYTGKGAKLNDGFPPKAELLARFNAANELAIKWVQGLTDADRAKPMPEKLQSFAPTVGHLAFAIALHVQQHVGQFQVIRRKLNKPILF
jgi:hypothetical protein